MGKILQIRVSASTHDPREVSKAWPRLAAMVQTGGVSNPDVGLLELIEKLHDQARFGLMPAEVKQLLLGDLDNLTSLKGRLAIALENWQAQEANVLSDSIEDAMTKLEARLQEQGTEVI